MHSIRQIVDAGFKSESERKGAVEELANLLNDFHTRLVELGWKDAGAAELTRILLAGLLKGEK